MFNQHPGGGIKMGLSFNTTQKILTYLCISCTIIHTEAFENYFDNIISISY